jgi:indolepyruvate ferredoxin oxidoreductase
LEALVRLALDQVRRDRAAGRRVAALYSGYPGSPLGGLDQLLKHVSPLLAREGVRLEPGLNEELAASTIAGTQLLDRFPHAQYDGVLGLWFGKAPGLDRALDAIRHANFTGISSLGGALALVGDDPACKSSSLPSHSEHALAHAFVPTLFPADSLEILELGRHAVALSRYAGVWVALRVVAEVADGGRILSLPSETTAPVLPKLEIGGRPFRPRLDPGLLPPTVHRIEEELIFERLAAVREYAHANGLNPITHCHARDRIGIVAAGQLYAELRSALSHLGLSDAELERCGIRLLRIQMVYPLDPRRLRDFADGLDEIIVCDTRRAFVEEQVSIGLANMVDRPLIVGQRDEHGAPWIGRHHEITGASLAIDLGEHLARRLARPELLRRARGMRGMHDTAEVAVPHRSPHFCSGCPHSTSTRVPEGALVGGGIGCHTMTLHMDRAVQYVGAMGSEGAQWIGLAPYVDTRHLFQNLGDGTYSHSGRLAVRAAVCAGVTITYKLLYNGHIAMTGGQDIVGLKPVAQIALDLLSDGVARIVAVTDDPSLRSMATTDTRIDVIDRADYGAAMRTLAAERGVTVLLYDEVCANQKARLVRRGVRPRPTERVVIHQDVCEGCGDCGRKTSCLSLWPVDTPLGRKTRIHETSCTDDRACLDGDCPAFMIVPIAEEASGDAHASLRAQLASLAIPEPEPAAFTREVFEIVLVGVGSTGVVTVNATLVRAAEIEGLEAAHVDQTGLSQRGGRVVSHCVLSVAPIAGSARVSAGADVLLALDPLGASEPSSLRAIDRERTRVLLHDSFAPTAEMVADATRERPSLEALARIVAERAASLERVPAERLATAVLCDTLSANVVVLGAALQLGMLPLRLASLECAIRDRGVAVAANLTALRLGRMAAWQPDLAKRWLAGAACPSIGSAAPAPATADTGAEPPPSPTVEAEAAFGAAWTAIAASFQGETLHPRTGGSKPDGLGTIAAFALDLVDYQSAEYALRYLRRLAPLADAEARMGRFDGHPLTVTAARELYRAMAYKDEYEVARLLLRGPHRRWLDARAGGRARVRYSLHPPLLRALGLRRKLSLGRAAEPLLRVLVRLRRLRGGRLDPFRALPSRMQERAFIAFYEEVLAALTARLTPANLDAAHEIAAAPGGIRGFEAIKHARLAQVTARMRRQLDALAASAETPSA